MEIFFLFCTIFCVISSSQAYTLTENLLGSIVNISNNGCPTALGLFIHTIVFMLALYLIMNLPKDL